MSLFITIVHIVTCLLLVAVVLLQHGRGADVGAAFGSGASQTVFGAAGAGNFLTRLTTGAAIIFMLTSLALSYFSSAGTVTDLLEEEAVSEAIFEPEVEEPAEPYAETFPIEPPGTEAAGSFEEAPPAEGGAAPPADPPQ